MKSNLLTRIIIDTENNKAYLSIEGKVEKATEEEKIKLRDTLVNAFSHILGLSTESNSGAEMFSDFEPSVPENGNEEEIVKFLYNSNKKEKTEDIGTDSSEPEPIMGIGKYPKLTASQIIEQFGEEGAKYLKQKLLPVFQQKIDKYPQNKAKIEAILKALKARGEEM